MYRICKVQIRRVVWQYWTSTIPRSTHESSQDFRTLIQVFLGRPGVTATLLSLTKMNHVCTLSTMHDAPKRPSPHFFRVQEPLLVGAMTPATPLQCLLHHSHGMGSESSQWRLGVPEVCEGNCLQTPMIRIMLPGGGVDAHIPRTKIRTSTPPGGAM